MRCSEFRRKHDAYIDDTLSAVEMEAMHTHRRVCDACSQTDTRLRRALLVARNLPTIEPSADFGRRLHERLEQERLKRQLGTTAAISSARFSAATYTIVAAGMLFAAGIAGVVTLGQEPEQVVVQMAPVVATQPEGLPTSLTAPTIVAAMPAGMPLWPAMYVAQEAPWHLASDEASR